MRQVAVLLTIMGLMVALFAATALAATKVGTSGPDRLVGTAENDTLRGLGGGDTPIGKGDSDRLFGGAGNDFIDARDPGRPEGDRVDCGAGFDRVVVDPSTEDIVASDRERVRVG
jgi:Ca2+-binding RTX toxin-like protein